MSAKQDRNQKYLRELKEKWGLTDFDFYADINGISIYHKDYPNYLKLFFCKLQNIHTIHERLKQAKHIVLLYTKTNRVTFDSFEEFKKYCLINKIVNLQQ